MSHAFANVDRRCRTTSLDGQRAPTLSSASAALRLSSATADSGRNARPFHPKARPIVLPRPREPGDQRDEESPVAEIIAEDVQSLRQVRDQRVKRLELKVRADMLDDQRLVQLMELSKRFAGATPVAVSILL